MSKKPIMACMAIAAFAVFVVAPAASASPVLTSGGVQVPTGTSITGKNTGNVEFTGGFNVVCSTADLKGSVTSNTGTSFGFEVPAGSSSFTGTGGTGACTSALGAAHWKIVSKTCYIRVFNADSVTVTGCGANVTYTIEVTGLGPCKYSTASVTGTFKTNAAGTVNVESQSAAKHEGGIFCPASGTLKMDFDLYTTDGTVLTVS